MAMPAWTSAAIALQHGVLLFTLSKAVISDSIIAKYDGTLNLAVMLGLDIAHPLTPDFTFMTIDPKSLRLFVQVMQAGTIAAVAQREHIAAAAISRRIADLETTLGVALVERSNKGLLPTAAGQTLINRSHRVLNELDGIALQMHEYVSGVKGYIRIHANMSATNQFLPTELQQFLSRHPNVRIDLTEALSTEIAQSVADNAADIGILVADESTKQPAGAIVGKTAGVEYLPYRNDTLVIITAQDHPLSSSHRVRFAQTLDYVYVGLPQGSQLNLQLSRAALALGRAWQSRFQVASYHALCLMVEADLGIGLVPLRIAQTHAKALNIRQVQLDEPWARRQLNLCVRSIDTLSPSAKLLVQHMTQFVTATSPQTSLS